MQTYSDSTSAFISVIAALLAISVVRGIDARQDERYKRLMFLSQQQFWSAGVAPPNFT